MARSYEYYKEEVKDCLIAWFSPYVKVLDVGAGEGTYYNLLKEYFENIDAVEVFKPNVEKYDLKNKYKQVFNEDIRDFKYEYYDLIIFGDVLEHMSTEDAKKVLKYALERSEMVLVAVPYCYKQGIEEENEYEIHVQDDLTKENMLERYPELGLLIGNEEYGYYVNKEHLKYVDFSEVK